MLDIVIAVILMILLAAILYIAYDFKRSCAGMVMSLALAISLVVLLLLLMVAFLVCRYREEMKLPVGLCMCILVVLILFALIVVGYIGYTGICIENPKDEDEEC